MAVKRHNLEDKQNNRPSRRPRAATSDILGQDRRLEEVPVKWRKHYRQLLRFRNFLLNRKGDLTRDAKEEQTAFSQHMADAGTDSFDRDFALSRISSEQDAAYEIEEAINRIFNRTYGTCEVTGKPIEPERLEAIPWTRFSVEAERDLERDGSIRLTRLAPREPLSRVTPSDSDSDSGPAEETRRES